MNASGGKKTKQRENYLLCVRKTKSCLVLAKEQSACQHDLGQLLDRVSGKEKATYTLCQSEMVKPDWVTRLKIKEIVDMLYYPIYTNTKGTKNTIDFQYIGVIVCLVLKRHA